MMNKDIFVKLLQERRYKSVKDVLDVMNAVDIASLLGEFDDKELALAFRLIPKEKAADVFANMESSLQSVLVEVLSEKELKEILDDLYMDDTVDLLEELPANLVTRILDASGPKERETINKLLNYPEDSAGSIMTTEYVDLKPHLTVGQALAHIKETGIHKETIYTCYVIQQRKLLGIVSAKDLLTTDDDVLIEDIMETEIISVSTLTDKEEVAHQLRKYDLLALPVLDNDGYTVGTVLPLDLIPDNRVFIQPYQRVKIRVGKRVACDLHVVTEHLDVTYAIDETDLRGILGGQRQRVSGNMQGITRHGKGIRRDGKGIR